MEKSFDFGALLRNHEKKHKSKPTQFLSVAGGVKKRLENNLKLRKSSRLTIFDNIRNLSPSSQNSPAPISEAKQKVELRRQQLQKWKEEKEKQKKEAAAKKKKPFVAGVPHNPLKFVPPPPPPKAVPSTSGRVTRSQSAKIKKDIKVSKSSQSQSFAPKDAVFKAPIIRNLTKLPSLAPVNARKGKKLTSITFEPILPKLQTEAKQTRSKTFGNTALETKVTRSTASDTRVKGNITQPNFKTLPKYVQSSSSSESEHSSRTLNSSKSIDDSVKMLSSSSENDQGDHFRQVYSSPSTETDSAKSLQSSSSNEIEPDKKQSPILRHRTRKTLAALPSAEKPKTPKKCATPLKMLRVSLVDNIKFTPNKPVPKSESSSEERLRSPKSPVDVPMTPEQIAEEAKKISPCVTMSRGKANARKEMKKKLEEGLLDEDACDMDSIDHFRRQLTSEIKRMTEMCDTWDKIQEQVALPDVVLELVLGAVGQARLLMSQKMQQFASLVERCARAAAGAARGPEALVTPADLHGFWDMLFMQVENVDMRFKKLEELKARNWVDEPVQVKRKAVKAAPKPAPKPAAKPKAAGGTSRLREVIAAARKAKKEEVAPATVPAGTPGAVPAGTPGAVPAGTRTPEDKTFEAGFFCVRSPLRSARSPLATPPGKHNLLKAVLSSEAKKASATKKSSSSFAMLRASVLGKNVECDGVEPLPQTPLPKVNVHATPGRSILKPAQDSTVKKGGKAIKVVLFDRSDNEIDTISLSETDCSKTVDTDDTKKYTKINTETDLSSNDVDQNLTQKNKDKENSRRKSKLTRQDAVTSEQSPSEVTESPHVMTRSRRKSMQTPQPVEKTPRRNQKKKVLEEIEHNIVEKTQTPKRSTRSRKSGI